MRTAPFHYRSRCLFLALALVLFGAQVLQSGHLHADHGVIADCLQCQLESGQAAPIEARNGAVGFTRARELHPDIAAAPVSTFYRLAARGPPSSPFD